jgi:hypothetical protein
MVLVKCPIHIPLIRPDPLEKTKMNPTVAHLLRPHHLPDSPDLPMFLRRLPPGPGSPAADNRLPAPPPDGPPRRRSDRLVLGRRLGDPPCHLPGSSGPHRSSVAASGPSRHLPRRPSSQRHRPSSPLLPPFQRRLPLVLLFSQLRRTSPATPPRWPHADCIRTRPLLPGGGLQIHISGGLLLPWPPQHLMGGPQMSLVAPSAAAQGARALLFHGVALMLCCSSVSVSLLSFLRNAALFCLHSQQYRMLR